MDKHAFWKWLILICLVSTSVALIYPPLDRRDAQGNLKSAGKIRFGLDLRGGTSFTVKIDESKVAEELRSRFPELKPEEIDARAKEVLRDAQTRAVEVLRNRIDNLGIAEPSIYPGKNNRIIIQLPGVDEKKRAEAEQSIRSAAYLEFRMVHENNDKLIERLFSQSKAPEGYTPSTLGNGRVYVRTSAPLPSGAEFDAYRDRLGRFQVPSTRYEFMLEKDEIDGLAVYRPLFVERAAKLTGSYVKNAMVDFGQMGESVVRLQFDGRGAKKFAEVTTDYAPGGRRNPNPQEFQQLAIVLDGTVYSAPVIKEAILGGSAEISGSFTPAQSGLLANILKAGALPAPVKIEEVRSVDPSLGKDAIASGVKAVVYGSVGVFLFMLVYYLFCGGVANIALLLNVILLPLGMIVTAGFMGIFVSDGVSAGGVVKLPVLTLPGIAGIVLTIGMAVDANVLIFERIREELRTGKGVWASITAGYDRAFLAILDSNLTTILTGVILFIFGTGPIRGYAVTLNAGLIISMYTALTCTRMIFAAAAPRMTTKSLKMLQVIQVPKIDYIKYRKVAIAVSLVVIGLSWAIMVVRGMQAPGKVFGVDFTGGASVTFAFEPTQKLDVEAVRGALSAAGVKDASIQYQSELETGKEWLQVRAGSEGIGAEKTKPVDVIRSVLPQQFAAAKLSVVSTDEVGPQVGGELIRSALWAMTLSLLGIILYLAWRFEFGFALGAIVALLHDVLVTVGVFSLCGKQLSLTVVAALLTIIGFSVNDTIVIFDRIRENLRLNRNATFWELCNLSVNQTMSRTILTSFTVMITVAMLLVFGGGAINDFALTLFIGIITGTYSTVFIATPVVIWWHKGKRPEFAPMKVD